MATLNTPYGILSFPHVFQPSPRAEGGEAVFSCVIIFDQAEQKSKAYKDLQDACVKVVKEKYPSTPLKNVKMPFRDAGEKAGKYQGYAEGQMYISPWSKSKPGVVDVNRQEVLLPEELWAGQLVRLNVTPYAWTNSGRVGVSFALNHIQIIRTDTPRIDGRASAASAFDDGEVDENANESPF